MAARLATLLAVVLVASAIATPMVATSRAAAASSSSSCDQQAIHDVFRTSEAAETFNESGETSSRAKNTQVTVKDVTGFVRINADNPNGYCVSYTVEISPDIVSPADLGKIEAVDSDREANWRAAQNLSSGNVYTRITFTLPANESSTFAPSTVRVKSLSWTGTAKQESDGVLDSVRSLWGSDKLEQREYTIEPTDSSSRITVPLSNNGEKIEEWQASYTINDKSRPVTQDAEEPVYYTEGSDSVTFHFSDKAVSSGAKVDFTADPTTTDKLGHSAESYWSGLSSGSSWLPFAAIPTEAIA